MAIVVYKVGGSLLTLPNLAERLRSVLQMRTGTRSLLVMGGGETADVVRKWDRRFLLGDEPAHWLALQALSLNESLLCRLLPEAVRVDSRDAAEVAWQAGQTAIAHAFGILRTAPMRLPELPHNWNVTSDSIAAWIAGDWSADELILLKSVPLPENATLAQARDLGLIDAHFPEVAPASGRVGWVHLRSAELRIDQFAS